MTDDKILEPPTRGKSHPDPDLGDQGDDRSTTPALALACWDTSTGVQGEGERP
jgi:hypothetical protein